jgi:hypothetical protein
METRWWGQSCVITSRRVRSEKDAKLAQKLGKLQSFIAMFPQECMDQLASFGTI